MKAMKEEAESQRQAEKRKRNHDKRTIRDLKDDLDQANVAGDAIGAAQRGTAAEAVGNRAEKEVSLNLYTTEPWDCSMLTYEAIADLDLPLKTMKRLLCPLAFRKKRWFVYNIFKVIHFLPKITESPQFSCKLRMCTRNHSILA